MNDSMKESSPKPTGISSANVEGSAIRTVSSRFKEGLGEKAKSVARMVMMQPALTTAALALIASSGCAEWGPYHPTSREVTATAEVYKQRATATAIADKVMATTRASTPAKVTVESVKTPEKQVSPGFTVYRSKNSEASYKINYPTGWYNGVDTEHGISFYKGPANESKEDDQFTTVRISNVDSYSELTKLSLGAYKDQKVLEYRQKYLRSDYKVKPSAQVKESKVTVNGRNMWKLEIDYRESVSKLDLKIVKYIFEENGTKWEIEFSSKPENFEKELPKFEQMFSSFKTQN